MKDQSHPQPTALGLAKNKALYKHWWDCCIPGRSDYEHLSITQSVSKAWVNGEMPSTSLLGWWSPGSHHLTIKSLLLMTLDSSPPFTSTNILVQGWNSGDISCFYMLESQVFTLPSRCSQDAARGQRVNDLMTNRKEKIYLEFSEDCLYLNIYTPGDFSKNSRLPVSLETTNLVPCATASGSLVWLEGNEGS